MSNGAHVDAGRRPPVLFLTGIGLTAAVAQRSIAALEAHFRVVAPPLGATPAPLGANAEDAAPSARWMTTADDAVAALDGAGVEQAHVVGLSFGGMIAQELAIRHPRRVRSLVLASSSAGGGRYVPPEPAIRHFLRGLDGLPFEEGLWAAVPYVYSATTRGDRAPLIGDDIARRLSSPLDPRSYRRQYAIAQAHDAGARLAQITAPTLVMHGEQDRILPLENGRMLADGIVGARFMALPGGGHGFTTDLPDASEELVSFLLVHSPSPAGSAATRSARATRA
ncbi:MAG TPA: alpha/beta hydrolase [Solirubrobacteraceae bacterium]|jgi:pimeloyl-ACP methyl ester carboxylesterase